MKLSEAIRLGSMLHPQGFNSMRSFRYADGSPARFSGRGICLVATCALGAAEEAGYGNVFESQEGDAPDLWCPACSFSHCLADIVAHLNDRHRWTREQITDWVATVEPPESVPVETTESVIA